MFRSKTQYLDKQGHVDGVEVTEGYDSPHSVQLALNSKGEVQFEVKCYGMTPEEASKSAILLFRGLAQEFKVQLPGEAIDI